MLSSTLRVTMLGGFSIKYNDKELTISNSRSRKTWLLLSYLIYYRKRRISHDELIDLLWPRGSIEKDRINPANTLKTTLHRTRAFLNQLDDSVGHTLISLKDGNYAWNKDIKFYYDVDEFETLVNLGESSEDEDERLNAYLKAIKIYQGDFLPDFSSEPWVIPTSTYYHNTYIHAVLNALHLLEKNQRFTDVVDLCQRALKIAPDYEGLYQHLMQNLLILGKAKDVVAVYKHMRQLFLGSFGIMPSEEVRSIYHDALYNMNHQSISMEQVLEQLKEPGTAQGVLFCDYDLFKTLYHAEVRAAARTHHTVHLCLLTIREKKGVEISRKSLERCMDNLHKLINNSLRKSDIVSRCSVSQYLVLLPKITHQNCILVCERLQQAFYRTYPHSPGELEFTINPPLPIRK